MIEYNKKRLSMSPYNRYMRGWRKKNKEKVLEYQRRYYHDLKRNKKRIIFLNRETYNRKRVWLNQQKNKPCMDCGVAYPSYVMQFDHVRGRKKFNISNRLKSINWKRLHLEIKKCDVVCANCHMERTWGKNGPSNWRSRSR